MKINVQYGKCSIDYRESTVGAYLPICADPDDRHDLLQAAVYLFCDRHFMAGSGAHCDTVDARTRGCVSQTWRYDSYGRFLGWITASVCEEE